MSLNIENMSLKAYFTDTIKRCPKDSLNILEVLQTKGSMNMERLSISAEINRGALKKSLVPLEVMGFVVLERYGMAKEYSITPLGKEFLRLSKQQ